jgi:hypothetical protein
VKFRHQSSSANTESWEIDKFGLAILAVGFFSKQVGGHDQHGAKRGLVIGYKSTKPP